MECCCSEIWLLVSEWIFFSSSMNCEVLFAQCELEQQSIKTRECRENVWKCSLSCWFCLCVYFFLRVCLPPRALGQSRQALHIMRVEERELNDYCPQIMVTVMLFFLIFECDYPTLWILYLPFYSDCSPAPRGDGWTDCTPGSPKEHRGLAERCQQAAGRQKGHSGQGMRDSPTAANTWFIAP